MEAVATSRISESLPVRWRTALFTVLVTAGGLTGLAHIVDLC